MDKQFLLEKTLYERSKRKSATVRDAIYLVKPLLAEYTARFVTFDDHSITHSMRVLNNANLLIGDNVKKLNDEEIFLFILACYAHDLGMGVTDEYYKEHFNQAVDKKYLEKHPNVSTKQILRKFHNEYSGILVRELNEYEHQLSEDEISALALLCRSHRNLDLTDRNLIPTALKVDDTTVNMAYLSPLLRLADELDLTNERQRYADHVDEEQNPFYIEVMAVKKYIERIDINDEEIIVVFNEYPEHNPMFEELKQEIRSEFHYCADIINKEAPFSIASQIKSSLAT